MLPLIAESREGTKQLGRPQPVADALVKAAPEPVVAAQVTVAYDHALDRPARLVQGQPALEKRPLSLLLVQTIVRLPNVFQQRELRRGAQRVVQP